MVRLAGRPGSSMRSAPNRGRTAPGRAFQTSRSADGARSPNGNLKSTLAIRGAGIKRLGGCDSPTLANWRRPGGLHPLSEPRTPGICRRGSEQWPGSRHMTES